MTGRCAACKYLRRRCASDCIFSPYFPSNNPQRFEIIHQIYGASNVAKMLQQVPVHIRGKTADSLCYEAECRIREPVYGCVGKITRLVQQINDTHAELARTRALVDLFNHHYQYDGGQSSRSSALESDQIQNSVTAEPSFSFY